MRIIIPFKPVNPKSRLANILNEFERENLALLMLEDVIDVIRSCNFDPIVLSTDYIPLKKFKIEINRSDLNTAINSEIKKDDCCIIMSDLPLISKEIFESFIQMDGDVIIAPGKRGGTNMLLVRNKKFRVSYYGGSFFKHIEIAKKLGLNVKIFDSFFASIDIDTEEDLIELLLHGKDKKSARFLKKLGFFVEFKNGNALLRRVS